MKILVRNQKYDTRLETSDWRYSASIVGLIKYFEHLKSLGGEIYYYIDHDAIEYNSKDITKERYLLFAEYYFKEDMPHRAVEQILTNDELDEEQIKLVNDKLKYNSVMKKIFKGIKFCDENKSLIIDRIDENRLLLIEETFKNGKKMYANFSNSNNFFTDQDKICRLLNYYVDKGKKNKSLSYGWDTKTFNFEDELEFDFIPFAFSKSREAFFINNNYSIKQLIVTNTLIEDSENPRSTLFEDFKNSSNFIDFDVEVIVKERDNDYFQTIHIRKSAIKIFESINNYKALKFNYKVNDNFYIDFEKEITNSVLNNVKLDSLIELLFKAKRNYSYNIKTLITINTLIHGGVNMDKQMRLAYKSAKTVIEKIPENKVKSYRQKLISSVTFKDYGKFCEILLQLTAYSGVVFDFAYDLFEDFDKNKNVAYTFINALNVESLNNKNDGGNE